MVRRIVKPAVIAKSICKQHPAERCQNLGVQHQRGAALPVEEQLERAEMAGWSEHAVALADGDGPGPPLGNVLASGL